MTDPNQSGLKDQLRINSKLLGLDRIRAGAGVVGLVGFIILACLGGLLLMTEDYFAAMLILSVALLLYETGTDFIKVILSSFTIFFSTKHIQTKAVLLQETLAVLDRSIGIQRGPSGEIDKGPSESGATLFLPSNRLTQDMAALIEEGKDYQYAEYIAHTYFVDCHELYNFANSTLEFVANVMPLFGLIGTILGLIGMFDSLGANVTVEALTPQLALALKTTLYGAVFSSLYQIVSSRFQNRMKALEYDFDSFCRALQVLIQNKNKIEIVG